MEEYSFKIIQNLIKLIDKNIELVQIEDENGIEYRIECKANHINPVKFEEVYKCFSNVTS